MKKNKKYVLALGALGSIATGSVAIVYTVNSINKKNSKDTKNEKAKRNFVPHWNKALPAGPIYAKVTGSNEYTTHIDEAKDFCDPNPVKVPEASEGVSINIDGTLYSSVPHYDKSSFNGQESIYKLGNEYYENEDKAKEEEIKKEGWEEKSSGFINKDGLWLETKDSTKRIKDPSYKKKTTGYVNQKEKKWATIVPSASGSVFRRNVGHGFTIINKRAPIEDWENKPENWVDAGNDADGEDQLGVGGWWVEKKTQFLEEEENDGNIIIDKVAPGKVMVRINKKVGKF